MKTGLLWQDEITTDPAGLKRCIARAVARYYRKCGWMPDTCAVNEHTQGDVRKVGTVRVVGMPTVLRGDYWVGMEERP